MPWREIQCEIVDQGVIVIKRHRGGAVLMIEFERCRHILRHKEGVNFSDRFHKNGGCLCPDNKVIGLRQPGGLGLKRQGLRSIVDSVLVLLLTGGL